MNAHALQLLAVAGGGALGALARYGLSLWFIQAMPGRFSGATLVANAIGSFAMGVAYVLIVEKGVVPQIYRHLIMVGVLGAFTTFSTFSLEALSLMQSGHWSGAVGYVLSSVILSLLAVAAGYLLAQSLA